MIIIYDPIQVGEACLVEVQDAKRLARHWFDSLDEAWAFATGHLFGEDTFRHHAGITAWADWLRQVFGSQWKSAPQQEIDWMEGDKEEEELWEEIERKSGIPVSAPKLFITEEITDAPAEEQYRKLAHAPRIHFPGEELYLE